jgi:hypothetical protein
MEIFGVAAQPSGDKSPRHKGLRYGSMVWISAAAIEELKAIGSASLFYNPHDKFTPRPLINRGHSGSEVSDQVFVGWGIAGNGIRIGICDELR